MKKNNIPSPKHMHFAPRRAETSPQSHQSVTHQDVAPQLRVGTFQQVAFEFTSSSSDFCCHQLHLQTPLNRNAQLRLPGHGEPSVKSAVAVPVL